MFIEVEQLHLLQKEIKELLQKVDIKQQLLKDEFQIVGDDCDMVIDSIVSDANHRFGRNGVIDLGYIKKWEMGIHQDMVESVDIIKAINALLKEVDDIIQFDPISIETVQILNTEMSQHIQGIEKDVRNFYTDSIMKLDILNCHLIRLMHWIQTDINKKES